MAAAIADNTTAPDEIVQFVMSLIETWDLLDSDTGQPIAVGDYGELTIEQFNGVMAEFNAQMTASADGVKKTKSGPSSSTSTRSSRAKSNSHARLTG